MHDTYETPEVFELGEADELTLSCSCSGCDCCCGKNKSSVDVIEV